MGVMGRVIAMDGDEDDEATGDLREDLGVDCHRGRGDALENSALEGERRRRGGG